MKNERNERLVYVYAEYCPGDLFWGWWLYCCNIRYGLPDRNNGKYDAVIWLGRREWMVRNIFEELEIEIGKEEKPRRLAERFMESFPLGVILKLVNGRDFFKPSVEEVGEIKLWRLSKRVRELQLLDWKHGDEKEERRLKYCNLYNERVVAAIQERNNRSNGVMYVAPEGDNVSGIPVFLQTESMSCAVHPVISANGKFDAYSVAIKGRLELDAIAWGCWAGNELDALRNAAYYLVKEMKRDEIKEKDREVLVNFHWSKNRASKKYVELAEVAKSILQKYGVEVVKVKLEQAQ